MNINIVIVGVSKSKWSVMLLQNWKLNIFKIIRPTYFFLLSKFEHITAYTKVKLSLSELRHPGIS